jgi:N-acetylglucosaminyl-diphospho-decaprenol L-rhamnosyltransferase
MSLRIIIVNWNTRDLLAACLQSIFEHPPLGPFGVTVVDNASSDDSVAMLRGQFPDVTLVENDLNRGFAAANNQAMAASSEDVLLLNSDTRVLPGALAALQSCAVENPRAAIVGGQCFNPDGSFQSSYCDFPGLLSESLLLLGLARWAYSPHFPSHRPENSQSARGCDWIGGACLWVRRQAIAQVGMLDEAYAMYVEEVDWCWRMQRAGWTVHYCPGAHIIHHGGQSANRLALRQQVLLYRSKALFLERYRGRWTATLFRGLVRPAAALKSAYWLGRSLLRQSDRQARERCRAHWHVAASAEL